MYTNLSSKLLLFFNPLLSLTPKNMPGLKPTWYFDQIRYSYRHLPLIIHNQQPDCNFLQICYFFNCTHLLGIQVYILNKLGTFFWNGIIDNCQTLLSQNLLLFVLYEQKHQLLKKTKTKTKQNKQTGNLLLSSTP